MIERIQPKPLNWSNGRRYFYKYMGPETAKVVIANRTLRFFRPVLLNDPFDMGFDLQLHINAEHLKPRILEAMWEAHYDENPVSPANPYGVLVAHLRGKFPQMDRPRFAQEFGSAVDESLGKMRNLKGFHDEIRRFMEKTKVLCLAEAPDNILMWAHYAAAHTGIVLRLRSIPERDSMFGAAKPVQYMNEMPTLLDEDQIVALLSGRGSLADAGLLEKLIYTKSSHWSYEREWRISLGMGYSTECEFEDLKLGFDELDAVIFGTKVADADRQEVTELARGQNPAVSLYDVRPASHAFEFQLVELD